MTYDINGFGPLNPGYLSRPVYEMEFGERRPSLMEVRVDAGIGDRDTSRLSPNVIKSINNKIEKLEENYKRRHNIA